MNLLRFFDEAKKTYQACNKDSFSNKLTAIFLATKAFFGYNVSIPNQDNISKIMPTTINQNTKQPINAYYITIREENINSTINKSVNTFLTQQKTEHDENFETQKKSDLDLNNTVKTFLTQQKTEHDENFETQKKSDLDLNNTVKTFLTQQKTEHDKNFEPQKKYDSDLDNTVKTLSTEKRNFKSTND